MPSNGDFTLKILVNSKAIPEYEKNGRYYVECNLSTRISYKMRLSEHISGEIETQEWPVTPYQIHITAHNEDAPCYFRVFVDGAKVKGVSLQAGQMKTIKGFRDGTVIREFLFSMPRFAKDEVDRVEADRRQDVGRIRVECWDAVLRKSNFEYRDKKLEFNQANKKDCTDVTQGKYTMATSRAGRMVAPRALYRNVDSWRRLRLRSELSVSYHMAHTLQEMGFTLQPYCALSGISSRHRNDARVSRRHKHKRGNATVSSAAAAAAATMPPPTTTIKTETLDATPGTSGSSSMPVLIKEEGEDGAWLEFHKASGSRKHGITPSRKPPSSTSPIVVDLTFEEEEEEEEETVGEPEVPSHENVTQNHAQSTAETALESTSGSAKEPVVLAPDTCTSGEDAVEVPGAASATSSRSCSCVVVPETEVDTQEQLSSDPEPVASIFPNMENSNKGTSGSMERKRTSNGTDDDSEPPSKSRKMDASENSSKETQSKSPVREKRMPSDDEQPSHDEEPSQVTDSPPRPCSQGFILDNGLDESHPGTEPEPATTEPTQESLKGDAHPDASSTGEYSADQQDSVGADDSGVFTMNSEERPC